MVQRELLWRRMSLCSIEWWWMVRRTLFVWIFFSKESGVRRCKSCRSWRWERLEMKRRYWPKDRHYHYDSSINMVRIGEEWQHQLLDKSLMESFVLNPLLMSLASISTSLISTDNVQQHERKWSEGASTLKTVPLWLTVEPLRIQTTRIIARVIGIVLIPPL